MPNLGYDFGVVGDRVVSVHRAEKGGTMAYFASPTDPGVPVVESTASIRLVEGKNAVPVLLVSTADRMAVVRPR